MDHLPLQALRNLMPGGKQAAPTPQQPAAAGGTSCHVLGIGHGVHRAFLDGELGGAWALLLLAACTSADM